MLATYNTRAVKQNLIILSCLLDSLYTFGLYSRNTDQVAYPGIWTRFDVRSPPNLRRCYYCYNYYIFIIIIYFMIIIIIIIIIIY
jgi:hypothetical protein